MTQASTNSTFHRQTNQTELARPVDANSVEFIPTTLPPDLTTNAKRIWVDQVNESAYFTVDGVDIVALSASNNLGYVNVMLPPYNARGNGTADDTTAVQNAMDNLSASGGGVVFFPEGVYKMNILPPSGVVLLGVSAAPINAAYPHGTVFAAFNPALPVVRILGSGTTMKQGIEMRNILIDGLFTPASTDGIYIAGANYISFKNVSIINFPRYNIFVENLLNLSTFFVDFETVRTYNAGISNFRVIENQGLSSFVTTVSCRNFVSFTLPAVTTEGCVAYIGAEVYIDGYLEANTANFIVIDKDISPRAVLVGRGCIVDGTVSIDVIKCKFATNTWNITDFVREEVSIDGKIFFTATGTSAPASAFGGAPYYPRLNNPTTYGYLNFQDQTENVESGKLYPRMYVSGGFLFCDYSRVDSNGAVFLGTFAKTFNISRGATQTRIWSDANNRLRMKNSPGPAASDLDAENVVGMVAVPATATSTGSVGQIAQGGGFLYICTATNTWQRVATATF